MKNILELKSLINKKIQDEAIKKYQEEIEELNVKKLEQESIVATQKYKGEIGIFSLIQDYKSAKGVFNEELFIIVFYILQFIPLLAGTLLSTLVIAASIATSIYIAGIALLGAVILCSFAFSLIFNIFVDSNIHYVKYSTFNYYLKLKTKATRKAEYIKEEIKNINESIDNIMSFDVFNENKDCFEEYDYFFFVENNKIDFETLAMMNEIFSDQNLKNVFIESVMRKQKNITNFDITYNDVIREIEKYEIENKFEKEINKFIETAFIYIKD